MTPIADKAGALYDLHGEKLRFLIVGVLNTALGYLMFLVLLKLLGTPLSTLAGSSVGWVAAIGHSYYIVVQWVGWAIAVPISTSTMKYFAFHSKGKLLPQVGRAYFVYLPAQGISTVLLWLAVTVLHLSVPLGQLITVFITTIFSYVGHKYFTFKTPLEVGEVPPREMLEGE